MSSPNRGSRLLSGSRCQSLDCRTMLLSSADPAPGAVLMPLRAARLPGKQPEVAGHGAPPAHSRPLSPLRLPCPSPPALFSGRIQRDQLLREEFTNDGPTYKLPANCTEPWPATFLSTLVHSIPASGSAGVWTRNEQCGSLSLSLVWLRCIGGKKKKKEGKKSSLYFPFSFPSVVGPLG